MIEVACAVVFFEGKVLVAKRGPGRDEGFWEFPGGKKQENESIFKTAERELYEELGLTVVSENELWRYSYNAPDKTKIELIFIRCNCGKFTPKCSEHSEVALVPIPELTYYKLLQGDFAFANWLQNAGR